MIILNKKSDCCGCTACASICHKRAITMVEDEEGFLYPVTDRKLCVDCGLCEKVCPILAYDAKDVVIPNEQKYYALSSKDIDIKENSSSGGTFYGLAETILKSGGVVYGAMYNSTMQVVHGRVTDKDQLYKLQGSKYVQSDVRDIYPKVKQDLKEGSRVLFSGTPCQIESLNLYLRKSYENLLTVDVVCHGVPSPMLFRKYIQLLESVYGEKVVSINMRDKGKGWKQRFHFRIFFENGTSVYDTRHGNMWNEMFFSENISRPSCHECRFTNYCRPSDITIADFWGIQKAHPEFNIVGGVSLAMANTDKGLQAINNILPTYNSIEVSKEETTQPCLRGSVKPNKNRASYWNDVKKLPFQQLLKKYHRYGILDYYWHLYRLEFHIWRTQKLKKK